MSDPETGLSLIGNTEVSPEHKGKTFVTKVMVNAPSGVIVEFDKNGAHVNKAGVTEKITGHGQLDGFEYEVSSLFFSRKSPFSRRKRPISHENFAYFDLKMSNFPLKITIFARNIYRWSMSEQF